MNKIIIFHEVPVLAEALRRMFETRVFDQKVVAVSRLRQLKTLYLDEKPDAYLLFYVDSMINHGMDQVRELRAQWPLLKFVVYSGMQRDAVTELLSLRESDIVLDSGVSSVDFFHKVHMALNMRLHATEEPDQKTSLFVKLTPREKEFIYLALQGKSHKEIARILNRAENTVKIRASRLYKKLEVNSKTQAIHKLRMAGYFKDLNLNTLE